MAPVDPTQPPQGPGPGNQGGQQPLKPEVQKLRFEDIFDTAQIEEEMKRVFRVSKVIESEEKKSAEIHMKYLKIVQTAERFKHTQLVREKKEMLKMLEDEMRIQKNLAMGAAPHGPERVSAGKRVEAEFAEKMRKVEATYKPQIASQSLKALASEGSGVLGNITGKLAGFIELLPKLGTAMGAMSGIVTGLLAVFKLGLDRLADLTKLQAQLRAGGLGLGESARGVETARKAFNVLGQDMEVLGQSTDDVNRLVSEMAKAPDVLKELTSKGGPEAWKAIRDAMLKFGIDAGTTADMVVSASKDQNMSLEEVARMYVNAAKVAQGSRINFRDAFNSLININSEMRNLTFNTDEARKIFTATTFVLRNLSDLKLSPVEVQKFAAGIAGAMGSMTVEKLTGVLSFVKGRMPTEEELAKGLGLDTLVEFMTKAMGNEFKGPEALVKISKLMQELGIQLGNSPVQGAKAMQAVLQTFQKDHGAALQKVLDDNLAKQMTDQEKQAKKAADEFKKAQEDGFKAATQMVTPLDKLSTALGTFATKFVDQFMPTFSSFADNFDKFVRFATFDSLKQKFTPVPDTTFEASLEPAGTTYHSSVQRDMTRQARARSRRKIRLMEELKGM